MSVKNGKNRKIHNNIIMILVILITIFLCIAGYAYAKYTSMLQAETSAQVAKWSFKVNGSSNETQNFDLDFTLNPYTHIQGNKVAPRNRWLF